MRVDVEQEEPCGGMSMVCGAKYLTVEQSTRNKAGTDHISSCLRHALPSTHPLPQAS